MFNCNKADFVQKGTSCPRWTYYKRTKRGTPKSVLPGQQLLVFTLFHEVIVVDGGGGGCKGAGMDTGEVCSSCVTKLSICLLQLLCQ